MKKNHILMASLVMGSMITSLSCSTNKAETDRLQARLDSVSNELTACKAAAEKLEANKKLVSDLYQELFGDKNLDAIDKYIVPDYIQHNPNVADGIESLKNFLKSINLDKAPKEKIDIQHIGADGDFVYIHTRMKMGTAESSVIDIFRIEGDKVVEHWDVIQAVPKKAANDHPMF